MWEELLEYFQFIERLCDGDAMAWQRSRLTDWSERDCVRIKSIMYAQNALNAATTIERPPTVRPTLAQTTVD